MSEENIEKVDEQEQVQAGVAQAQEECFDYNFTMSEVNLILEALGDLPTKNGFNIVSKILVLTQQQQQKK